MTKRGWGLCLAVLSLLAVTIWLLVDGALIAAGGYGDGPPSVIATLKTEEGVSREALPRHPGIPHGRLRLSDR